MDKDETKLFYGRTQELKYDGVFVDTTKEKVKKLVDYMAWLKQKEDLQEIHLTRLNQFIEAFHNN